MDTSNGYERFMNHINERILPFIDYAKLNESYDADMVYARGILNRLHKAMVVEYGGDLLDISSGDEGFVLVPGVIRSRNSGRMCIALLEFDMSSSGEHWDTVYLWKYGAVSQTGNQYGAKEMNRIFVPYDYGYTAKLDNDIHSDYDDLPSALREILSEFHKYNVALSNEKEPLPNHESGSEKPSVLEQINAAREESRKPDAKQPAQRKGRPHTEER